MDKISKFLNWDKQNNIIENSCMMYEKFPRFNKK